ncbi:hypothetical protein [Halovulum marinum]|uniref:hypothetical protein n=1 Tax=Halovulum marinum TaxID=2662447 RepID=UPI001F304D5D|nr:hypothetical protein [Halovulum marinum]
MARTKAKAALAGIEAFRTIRKGQFENSQIGVADEIDFMAYVDPALVEQILDISELVFPH